MTRYYNISDDSTTTYVFQYVFQYHNGTNSTTTAGDYLDWHNISTIPYTTSSAFSHGQTYTVPYDIFSRRQEINREQEEQRPEINREQEEQRRQELLERQKAKIEAAEKARALLLEYLDNDNKQRLLNNQPLELVSKLFNNIKYHIPTTKLSRIKAWKENKVITELCVSVGGGDLPMEDIILTKFLYLLNDEENMLRTAKHWNVQENLLAELN